MERVRWPAPGLLRRTATDLDPRADCASGGLRCSLPSVFRSWYVHFTFCECPTISISTNPERSRNAERRSARRSGTSPAMFGIVQYASGTLNLKIAPYYLARRAISAIGWSLNNTRSCGCGGATVLVNCGSACRFSICVSLKVSCSSCPSCRYEFRAGDRECARWSFVTIGLGVYACLLS